MALPIKIEHPVYDLTLPISKKELRFRPFLKKEEKVLLMAMESKDEKEMLKAMKQTITNCVLDELNVESLSLLDIEYFFLQLRAKSVGEVIELKYRCDNPVNDNPCGNEMEVKLNLTEVTIGNAENVGMKIEFSPTFGIQMNMPRMDTVKNIVESKSANTDYELQVITSCIEFVYQDENIFYAQEYSEEEIMDFLNSLTKLQYSKVEEFFIRLPYLYKDIPTQCSKCGFQHNIHIEGYQNFFD